MYVYCILKSVKVGESLSVFPVNKMAPTARTQSSSCRVERDDRFQQSCKVLFVLESHIAVRVMEPC